MGFDLLRSQETKGTEPVLDLDDDKAVAVRVDEDAGIIFGAKVAVAAAIYSPT